MNAVHYSSNRQDWETPDDLFEILDSQYNFTLDVCATHENAKCKRYFTEAEDGLAQRWEGVCWMNPPYGRGIERWVEKAYKAAQSGATVVCLLPARTDTRWFHDYVQGKADVEFLKGRIRFKGATSNAPFPSMVAVFKDIEPFC